jgi:hypothetical protein
VPNSSSTNGVARLIPPGVKLGDARRGPAASVQTWRQSAEPVGTSIDEWI